MRYAAWVERVIRPRLKVRDARTIDGLDLFDLRLRELLGLFDKDHVIFERKILVDIFFVLKVTDLDGAVVWEIDNAARWPVLHPGQYLRAKLLHRLFGRACFLA